MVSVLQATDRHHGAAQRRLGGFDRHHGLAACGRQFRTHIAAHSRDKPGTARRYSQILEHLERLLGTKGFIESITRADVDDYKVRRRQEQSQRGSSRRAQSISKSALRTFLYYLISERGVQLENPCTRFKRVRDVSSQASRRPPTYTQDELKRLFEASDAFERTTSRHFS